MGRKSGLYPLSRLPQPASSAIREMSRFLTARNFRPAGHVRLCPPRIESGHAKGPSILRPKRLALAPTHQSRDAKPRQIRRSGGFDYACSSPDTHSVSSLVLLTNSASRSIPHLLARTMIDHKQSDSSCPSLALQSSISRTPALAWISFARSPTSPTKPSASSAVVQMRPHFFISSCSCSL